MVRLFGREDRRRHELLSAYVDGEVTAEEASEVEELLASSEDARRELAELQATVDLVRELPELEPPRSFALDAAPKKRWTLWWPSVRTTGLATSVAAMLLVALVAAEMLNVLEQARFGADESEYVSDESAFAAAAPEAVLESGAVAAMDAPASPEPEAVLMKSAAVQDESTTAAAARSVPAPPMAAAQASDDEPQTKADESSEEPVAAMQKDTTEEKPEEGEAESGEEPQVGVQQVMATEAPQPDAAESSEEPPVAKQQAVMQDAPILSEEVQAGEAFDDREAEGIALPLVELQVVTAIVVMVLVGATLVAIFRRRRSVP